MGDQPVRYPKMDTDAQTLESHPLLSYSVALKAGPVLAASITYRDTALPNLFADGNGYGLTRTRRIG